MPPTFVRRLSFSCSSGVNGSDDMFFVPNSVRSRPATPSLTSTRARINMAAVVGTCDALCPPSEAAARPRHMLEAAVMVKRYARRGAGMPPPPPVDVRTPSALLRATVHVASLARKGPRSDTHVDFCCDRFRAVRQDFLLQNGEHARPAEYEAACRLQARVLLVFAGSRVREVDPRYVRVQLEACLSVPRDTETQSLACLLDLFASHAPAVLAAVDDCTLALLACARLGDYVRFFAVLRARASPLQRCAVAAGGAWRVQARALLALSRTCRCDILPSDFCSRVLAMPDAHVHAAAAALRLATTSDGRVRLGKKEPVAALDDVVARFAPWEPPWALALSPQDAQRCFEGIDSYAIS